jgi:hypothetical protein
VAQNHVDNSMLLTCAPNYLTEYLGLAHSQDGVRLVQGQGVVQVGPQGTWLSGLQDRGDVQNVLEAPATHSSWLQLGIHVDMQAGGAKDQAPAGLRS